MAQGQVAADFNFRDLNAKVGVGNAESRAGSNAFIEPVTIGGLVVGNNYVLLGAVGIIAFAAILILRKK